ncbi:hypothetical protein [Nocardia sp. NPDC051750]|uniref:hypothetical protein n=1 Tax=Nocardia sp. NPDC051750 TaxID=3364325 RepID=UPI0037BB8E1D
MTTSHRRGLHIHRRHPATWWAAAADLDDAAGTIPDSAGTPVFRTLAAAEDRAAVVGGDVVLIAHHHRVRVCGLAETLTLTAVIVGGLSAGYAAAAAAAYVRENL